jgi:NCS1 family nucleobase:cation symporter-1
MAERPQDREGVRDEANFLVETHSIDVIPPEARHGKVSSLFPLWFGANTMAVTITTGMLVVVKGFSLEWAIVAVTLGVLIGAIFMAYHSAQGPHLGLPQMIQSRAQFGYYGASLPLILVVAMYVGFFAAGGVLGGQALALLFHMSLGAGIIIMSLANCLLALFGYNLIHRYEYIVAWLFAATFVVFTGFVLFNRAAYHAQPTTGTFMLGPFLLGVAIAAIYEITYAPYVADYSRYLPESTSIRSAFWYTYGGTVVSGVWMMILGVLVAAWAPSSNPIADMAGIAGHLGGWFQVIVLLMVALGIVSINTLNIYGGFMSSLTIVSAFVSRWRPTLALRVWFIIPVTIVSTYLTFLYSANLLTSYENFLSFLLYFMIPWTAVNLTDFYFVRRGRYNLNAFGDPAGEYRGVAWPGIVAYFVGFLAEIPFMNSPVYEGPVARALQGGDISWIIGVLVSGGLYFLWMRRVVEQAPSANTAGVAIPNRGN